ncbi:phage terminase large subunit family protein [Candidatus Woesearchaeota archaeon]|nr:phage terminase large subunit family protein [Candidatus Woesearchaeota archaeon]
MVLPKPKIEDVSIIAWLFDNQFVNEKGELLSFREHPYLFDIYRDFSPHQAIKKAAQVGMSVTMVLKALFMAKTRGLNLIYTLPSDDDVHEFVPTKVDKIIQSNPAIANLLKNDKVELKEIAGRFIHFKGTRSKTAPIMTTADLLIHDEKDRSEQPIIEQYGSRLARSAYKGVWALSNPSTSGSGIDMDWQASDKKEWFIVCPTCQKEQFLTFEENVSYEKKAFICKECGVVLSDADRTHGRWQKTSEGIVSGYHVSQLMCPWISAEHLIYERETKGREYFNNFILGEPFDVTDIKIRRELVTDLWVPYELEDNEWFLGVDSGKTKHWVLGNKKGISDVGATDDWEDVEFLITKYNATTIIDALPDLTIPELLRRKYPKVYLCYYKRDRQRAESFSFGKLEKDIGLVFADRNRTIDAVIDSMARGQFQIAVTGEKLKPYVDHWMTLRRTKEIDQLGLDRYVWESSSGIDHFVHATVYWWMAKSRGRGEEFMERMQDESPKLIVETSEGPRTTSLRAILDKEHEDIIGIS